MFLAVVLVFGLASIGLTVRLFQDVTREQSVTELRREASRYRCAVRGVGDSFLGRGREGARFAAEKLELATGDQLYYIGASLFPGQRFGSTRLQRSALGDAELDRNEQVIVEHAGGESTADRGGAQPIPAGAGTEPFGWLIVAKPEAELREQWLTLLGRLALALAVGVGLAAALFLALAPPTPSRYRPERVRPRMSPRGATTSRSRRRGQRRIALLSERFRGMVAQLAEAAAAQALVTCHLRAAAHALTAISGHVKR